MPPLTLPVSGAQIVSGGSWPSHPAALERSPNILVDDVINGPIDDTIYGEKPAAPPLVPTQGAVTLPLPIDPGRFRPDAAWPVPFPTENIAKGIKPLDITVDDQPADKSSASSASAQRQLLNADQIGAKLKQIANSKWEVLQQVAALLQDNSQLKYLNNGWANAHPSINQALAAGYAQCSGKAALGAYEMVQSGKFSWDEVGVGQGYLPGGLHNVIFFKNPDNGLFDALDYGNHITVGANTLDEAMTAYYGGNGKFILYKPTNPDLPSSPLELVKGAGQAARDQFFSQPGNKIGGMPLGIYRSKQALWEQGFTAPTLTGTSASVNNYGVSFQRNGVSADAVIDPKNGFDRFTLSSLEGSTRKGAVLLDGVKLTVGRDSSGSGAYILMGGEWWHISNDYVDLANEGSESANSTGARQTRKSDGVKSYYGFIGALDVQYDITSQRLSNQNSGGAVGLPGGPATMTALAPTVNFEAGNRIDLVGKAGSRLRATLDFLTFVRAALPIDMTPEARQLTLKNTSGESPLNGYLEPGDSFMDNGAGGNIGFWIRSLLSKDLKLSAGTTARSELIDPTFAHATPTLLMPAPYVPLAMSFDGESRLSYRTPKVGFEVGARGGNGMYARDELGGGDTALVVPFSPELSLVGQTAGGVFKNGEIFFTDTIGLSYQSRKGIVVTANSGQLTLGPSGREKPAPVFDLSLRLPF